MRTDNFPEPVSDPETDGLPDTADDDSTAYDDTDSVREADGPDPAPLPGDEPIAIDRYGVTAEEARLGESLDYKLGREVFDGRGHAVESPVRDDGDTVDLGNDEFDRPGPDAGLADDPLLEPTDSPVSLYDRDDLFTDGGRPVGRLVEPDEGAHQDSDAEAFAWDAGSAGGGASAEELAMHETDEP
jgi:hypothetical protein